MAEPICEDEGLLQEWTPLTQLLQQIPLKTQRGFFSQNLNLTCLDVVSEFIALGTNLGFVYWYCRASGDLQRLKFENCHCSVSCIRIMPYVDYMVAAGTDQGTVIVFQIPKINPCCTSDEIKLKQKQIERFTINGLHHAPISSIEWDPNDVKVFSGDKIGCVVLTEINLNLHISKSMELLNEQFEIVQLSYSCSILLVSTVYRSIICDGSDNWKVRQVGTKERKILGKYGATLCKFQHGLVLYASRPGHRLWLSDKNGVVQQTLIFKSAIQSNSPKIQLINPIDKKEPYDTSFGKVIQFGDNKLITYNSEILYVLHLGAVSVVSVLNSARKILDLSVNENEIFILEGERSLLRIGPLPDKYSLELLYQPASRRTSFNFDEIAAKIKDTAVESIRKITKDFIPTNEQSSQSSPPPIADEALELPPIVNLPAGFMPTIFTGENIKIHSSVSDEDFSTSNNINYSSLINSEKRTNSSTNDLNNYSSFNYDWHEEVVRPLRKRHNKKPKLNQKGNTLVSESESDTTSNLSDDRLVCGVANDLSLSDESAFSHSQSSFSVLRDIPSLLGRQKISSKSHGIGDEDIMKTSDTKSQTSLDTCESVSERLLLSSEAFREEQERTFARLANQSLFDSFNSEKTDMSISNMTTSSSFSSKISENLPSYMSENSGVDSRTKSAESQNTDNIDNEMQSLSKGCWKWKKNFMEENSSQDENMKVSSESSASNRNSQKEEFYTNWTTQDQPESPNNFLADESDVSEEAVENNFESGYYKSAFTEAILMNGSCSAENKNFTFNESKDSDSQMNSSKCLEEMNQPANFSQSENLNFEEKKNEEEKKLDEFETKSFVSNELINYGPPSGSSLLNSQLTSDLSYIPTTSQKAQLLVRDSSDHWPQFKTPDKITSLVVCRNYVVCTDFNDRVYYSKLTELGLSWTKLDYKASMIRVANDGSALWLLKKNSVFALVNPSLSGPFSDTVLEIAQDVKSFAIDSVIKEGLLVTKDGKIISFSNVMMGLSEKEIHCDYNVADIACSGGMILALSSDFMVLCKLPGEDKFKVVKTSKPVTSMALGPENLLWVVDVSNRIFFSDDFMSNEPHWWQIQISDYIFQYQAKSFPSICNKIKYYKLKKNIYSKTSLVATNENSVWIFDKFDSFVCVNKTGFTGYMWNKVLSVKLLPNIQWQTLCAGGVYEDKGRIWLLSSDGNLFCTTPNYRVFQSLPFSCEENILCMTSSVDTLWILSESGRIHSRIGLSISNVSGTSWKEMKSSQIDNLKLVWISCGSDVAWACDIHGRTFITLGSSQKMGSLDPAWVEVEGRPKDVQFKKVFVGSQLYMVWAIDTNQNLYVREGILPHYQIGTSWVYVCGIKAIHITISGAYVWALASNGNIYRRCGVSESNFIGDYWRSVPGSVKMISSTSTDELWAISHKNEILQLSYSVKILRKENIDLENEEILRLKKDVSWEVV